MSSHQRIKQQLSEYLEGDLAQGAKQQMESHLAGCDDCASELRGLRRTRDLLRGLPALEPPPDLADAVMARLHAGEGAPGLAARFSAWWADFFEVGWPPPIAAAAMGLVAVAVIQGGDVSFVWGNEPDAAQVADARSAAPPITAPLVRASRSAAAEDRRSARQPQPQRMGEQVSAFAGSTGTAERPQGLPPFEACVQSGEPPASCIRLQAWTVGLGLADPDAFLKQVGALSPEARQVWLDRLGSYAAQDGSASALVRRLRNLPHPSAPNAASLLERGADPQR